MTATNLTPDQTAELADTFRLLADASRLGIVAACADPAMSVGAISDRLGLSPSLVSHHLRLLRASRIMTAERRGKQVFYTLADACVRDVLATMIGHQFGHRSGHDAPAGKVA